MTNRRDRRAARRAGREIGAGLAALAILSAVSAQHDRDEVPADVGPNSRDEGRRLAAVLVANIYDPGAQRDALNEFVTRTVPDTDEVDATALISALFDATQLLAGGYLASLVAQLNSYEIDAVETTASVLIDEANQIIREIDEKTT